MPDSVAQRLDTVLAAEVAKEADEGIRPNGPAVTAQANPPRPGGRAVTAASGCWTLRVLAPAAAVVCWPRAATA